MQADNAFLFMEAYGGTTSVTFGGISANNMACIKASGDDVMVMGTLGSTDLVFVTNDAERARINSSGNMRVSNALEIDGDLDHDGSNAGFYGTAPIAKPTVTGSRGGNAALASLLTQLANLGLITDSTSA